jgi:nicotinate-nucleotide adenylyltransferase
MGRVIGLLGGTFDPPHLGHLLVAENAREQLGLERVWWVVTPRSPLKPDREPTPAEVRAEMVEAAIAGQPAFQLSRAEFERRPPYYTTRLLEALRESEPEANFVFLLGSDSLADLPRWHDPRRLVELCGALGVVERPGHAVDLEALEARVPGVAAKVRRLSAPPVAVSGGDIRARVGQGRSIRYLVPEGVRRIIEERGLYRGGRSG